MRAPRCSARATPLLRLSIFSAFVATVIAGGCGPADAVSVLPLPDLDRPSPEARIGLPAIEGLWRFAGWEVIQGDSSALDRSFPTFGDLRVDVQRLDSIAGSFAISGAPVPIVGEVRRSGRVAMVTIVGAEPLQFVAGGVERDTLWLEMGSILPAVEWPTEARAAFVRGAPAGPMAWARGARRQVMAALEDSASATMTDTTLVARPSVGVNPMPDTSAGQAPGRAVTQPPISAPPPPPPPPPPPLPPPPPPRAEPDVVDTDDDEPDLPPLLGDPVDPDG